MLEELLSLFTTVSVGLTPEGSDAVTLKFVPKNHINVGEGTLEGRGDFMVAEQVKEKSSPGFA